MPKLKVILTWLLILPMTCHADLLIDAKSCVDVKSKLERLHCFDQVFTTPIAPQKTDTLLDEQPEEWKRATKNEERRRDHSNFILNEGDDSGDLWLTASAIGALPPRPILMLSCINGISRVELLLSHYFERNSMKIAFNSRLPKMMQSWQSDNSGTLFRTGRGLPAVKAMRRMWAKNLLTLHSDTEEIDGLQFNTSELKWAIMPLRKACRW